MTVRRHMFVYAVHDVRACRRALERGDLGQAIYWLSKAQWAFGRAMGATQTSYHSAAVVLLTAVIDRLQGALSRRVDRDCRETAGEGK